MRQLSESEPVAQAQDLEECDDAEDPAHPELASPHGVGRINVGIIKDKYIVKAVFVYSDDVDSVEDDDEQAHQEEDGSTFFHVRMVCLEVQRAEQVQDAPPHQAEERVLERIAGAYTFEPIIGRLNLVVNSRIPRIECFKEEDAEADECHEEWKWSKLLWRFAHCHERCHTAECVDDSDS